MVERARRAQVRRVSATFSKFMGRENLLQTPGWFDIGFSMAQFKALLHIVSTGGVPGRELALRLGIGPSAVTPLVEKLVRRGYVWREEDASDRRVSWARPTAAGTAVLEHVSAIRREGLEGILELLDPGELDLVENALKLLYSAAVRRVELENSKPFNSVRKGDVITHAPDETTDQ